MGRYDHALAVVELCWGGMNALGGTSYWEVCVCVCVCVCVFSVCVSVYLFVYLFCVASVRFGLSPHTHQGLHLRVAGRAADQRPRVQLPG
jgi:hypothetical protein